MMTAAGNPSLGFAATGRAALRGAVRLSYVALLVYHAALLTLHVWEGRLLQPDTSLRWLIGGLLFLGFVWLRRVERPVFWGRRAVALWLLVALLHGHAALSPTRGPDRSNRAEPVAVLLADVAKVALLAMGLLLVALGRRRRRSAETTRCPLPRQRSVGGFTTSAGFSLELCLPRPPPAA